MTTNVKGVMLMTVKSQFMHTSASTIVAVYNVGTKDASKREKVGIIKSFIDEVSEPTQ